MSIKIQTRIAYLGMGIMGASMAVNLAKEGFPVRVWNRTPGKDTTQRAVDAGASEASSVAEAVRDADIVMLCLTDVRDLDEILLTPGGVLSNAKAGTVVVDMSTTGPACARRMSATLSVGSLHFLDAPVSGGDLGARQGTLTIMVGGEKADFEKCLPVFQKIGKKIQYCGPSGSGQSVKLCNQILCAVNMLAVCESLNLAEKLGIDPQLMIDVCGSGAAGSWALTNLGARIAKGDLEPGFMIKDMQKDLRLVGEVLNDDDAALAATMLANEKFNETIKAIGENGDRKGTQAMSVTFLNSLKSLLRE